MSERMTSVSLPGLPGGCGLALWGRRTPQEAIAELRAMAARDLKSAQAILAAPDEDFRVTTYVGVHVRKKIEVLQEEKK